MALFIQGSGTAQQSSTTLGDAASEVAQVVGAQDTPEFVFAVRAIQRAMKTLNGRRWDYLSVRTDDLALVDHRPLSVGAEGYQGAYTVPGSFRDLISAKIKTTASALGGLPLTFVNRSDYDRAVAEATGCGTQWISFFQLGTTQKVELLEWPESVAYLELRYFRNIEIPTDSEQRLDVPANGPLESAIVLLAKEIVAIDKGELRKAKYVGDLGRMALQDAVRSDLWKGEDDAEWKLPQEWAQHRYPQKMYEGYGVIDSDWRW